MNSTGFSNEKSSEYTLLYDLHEKFKSSFQMFYPFHFHKKRDDTLLSFMNDIGEIQLIACFARRPKTTSIYSKKILLSFRQSMFEQADFLNKFNIPVFAGSPLGTKIDEIGFGSKCTWFQIESNINESYVEYIFNNKIIESECLIKGINLLDDSQIYKLMLSSQKYTWNDALKLIENWNTVYSQHYFMFRNKNIFNSVSGLKPVFIAYKML